MEYPDPDLYTDWREWARQLKTQLPKTDPVNPIEGGEQEPWTLVSSPEGPGFQNGWADLHFLYPVSFKKINGVVHFEGIATKPAPVLGEIIFVLPEGYRHPLLVQYYRAWPNANLSIDVFGNVRTQGVATFISFGMSYVSSGYGR